MKDTKYGLWTVLDEEKIYLNSKIYLKCECDCGATKNVIIKNLKSGTSNNCGCLRNRKTTERNTKHGKRHTRVWRIWQAMKTRCSNKNTIQYKNYGGRGITVCEEWKNDFMSFYKDMGECPKGCSIDRIDNNGNYEPSNVRWATFKEQLRNKSNNRKINGVCITDISRRLGGGDSLVDKRLKRGWTMQKAISLKSNASS